MPDWRPILDGSDATLGAKLTRGVLGALEPAYRGVVRLRNRSFDRGWRRAVGLGRPTISVGNLTTGGTGKTPMVIDLAHRLTARGVRPAVLLRGYHADAAGSDEAMLLREALGDAVPVEPDADRAAAAARVLAAAPDVGVFLLDDAFQHRAVRRDIDLVLLDAARPFGNGHVLPRGFLREPAAGLARATAVVVTHADLARPESLDHLDQRVTRLTGRPPLARTAHAWSALRDQHGRELPLAALASLAVLGVSGLGDPVSFELALQRHAARVERIVRFSDHHHYTQQQLALLLQPDARQAIDAIVTTEKDWVKWAPMLRGAPMPVPVYRPTLALRYLAGEEAVDTLLARLTEGTEARRHEGTK